MSIDRIGKGPSGIAPQGQGADPLGAKERTGKAFSVGEASKVTGTAGASSVSPAGQVRSGELSLDAYLDQRVAEATKHLEGKLPAADLADVQKLLRSQLVNDPAVAEMVRAATGVSPTPDE